MRELKKTLKENNYKYYKSVCNRSFGKIIINTIEETFIKKNTKIVILKDKVLNKEEITYFDKHKKHGITITLEKADNLIYGGVN